ncbi:MAG TPA: molybdopterin converting factor subunit 1 [Polyangiaceae bacterium]|jgi:molybdopterin synthase sulfur carrier subunit|nr:molybdopterin converting factor subunit 1 [Polyangiaceae bacterium]
MNVRVLYFAGARDVAGVAEETCDLPASVATVSDFARFVGERHPALAARMESVRIARNERFAEDDERVAEGDVLALIPPVAGG